MDKDNFISIGFVILAAIGVILFGVLFYKLIIEILHSSIHFASWFITTVEIALVIVAFCAGFILIILFLVAILWSIKKLGEQVSGYFSDLGDKVSQLLNKKPERILPLFIAVISQTFILMLSKEFTTSDTKKLLSFILYIILAIILITTSRQKKKFWGGLVVIVLLVLTTCLMFQKYQITNWDLFTNFIHTKYILFINRPLLDIFSISLIVLSFLSLVSLSLFYSFKKV